MYFFQKKILFTLIGLPVKGLYFIDREWKAPAHGQGKACFTPIELFVVIAITVIFTKNWIGEILSIIL